MREFKPLLGLDDLSKHSRLLLNIRVSDTQGREKCISACQADTVKSIKEKALDEKQAKEQSNYKVVLSRTKKALEDVKTLEQEGVEDNDELVIWRKRRDIPVVALAKKAAACKSVDWQSIKMNTEQLDEEHGQSATQSTGMPVLFDFIGELKRILTSLVEVASLLQAVNSEDKDDSDMDTDEPEIEIEQFALKQLTDMGFPENRAKKALIINRMSRVQAMDWLLQHDSDADIDQPLTQEEMLSYLPERRKLLPRKAGAREFTPNSRAVRNLLDMGFEEKDIIQALKTTGNHQEAALEWLLGDREQASNRTEPGLDPSSPMYASIMEHPVVQLGMTNPRILHAFEDMLENPNASAQYINDPEIGPVLLQISRIVQSFSR
eukprot:Seg1450.24 transcript_id=Seg1450.24/GoldUCD/mRNA.D3Y31 product="Ubiquitin-associated domain-containing protein 1" protein_id=Seg1450.24/GoldUCD/D3Y31